MENTPFRHAPFFTQFRHCLECHLFPRRIDFAPLSFARLYNSFDPEYIAA